MPDVELLELQTEELVLEFVPGAFPDVLVAILPAVPPGEITTLPWANVTGKPLVFAPDAHQHASDDVNYAGRADYPPASVRTTLDSIIDRKLEQTGVLDGGNF